MVRKLVIVALISIFYCGVLSAQQSGQIVYIDGTKYTVYTAVKGDTLYSLSKSYGVSVDDIIAANPVLSEGLKLGQTIKIPFKTETSKKAQKRSKRQFITHTVKKGETLYSLSRLYEISVNAITEDNDNIDPTHLKVGQKIYIRRSQVGLTDEKTTQKQIVETSQAMNSVAFGGYSYHVVHKGEDAANIATRFHTTVEKLLALNGFQAESNIREGLIIKVPKVEVAEDNVVSDTQTEVEESPAIEETTFSNLQPGSRANVALMLPMGNNGVPVQNYIDFYQGFLLATNHIRANGIESEINLFNTAHNLDKVSQIIDSGELDSANLIVGPVYEDVLIPVVRYAERRNIPIVSPLANLTHSQANNLFQMSPRQNTKYDKVRHIFDGSRRVVFITSDTTDREFEKEVKQMLGETPYITHHYIYEHPSIIEKREKARAEGEEVEPSPSDMAPLLSSDLESVYVILAGTEVELDRILAALASANISLTARSMKVAPYIVFGNNKWNRYRNIDRSLFFSNNVTMLSTYHTDRSNDVIQRFSAEYIKAFGSLPSLYSYRGYDAAMIFIPPLFDSEYVASDKVFRPLQTPYSFETDPVTKVRINSEWVRVQYNSNFTITAE